LALGLVGLAFSGGGIRSATFNLGVLQALGRLGLLRRIDYLSTVSGGGYIGAWLAAWIHRARGTTPAAKVETVERNLNSRWDRDPAVQPKAEPEPVQHLREHSRYLALNSGILTLDMWSLLSIYVRNVFINLLVVVPLLLAVVFGCRWLIAVFNARPEPGSAWLWVAAGTFLGLLFVATWNMRRSVFHVARDATAARANPGLVPSAPARGAGPSGFRRHVVFVSIALLTAYLSVWLPRAVLDIEASGSLKWRAQDPNGLGGMLRDVVAWLEDDVVAPPAKGTVPYLFTGGLFTAVLLLCAIVAWAFGTAGAGGAAGAGGRSAWAWLRYPFGIALNGFAFGAMYVVIVRHVLFYDPLRNYPALYVTFGPPLFVFAVLMGGYIEVAVAGSSMDEFEREWRSRIAALLFRVAFVWMLLFAAIVYLPYGVRSLNEVLFHSSEGTKAPWLAAVGWLVTTAGGFLAARRTTAHSSRWLLIVVRVVPVLFLIGLFAIGSELSVVLVRPYGGPADYIGRLENTDPGWASVGLGVALVAGAAAIIFVPATLFSLHALYMNRLTRCYLGASRRAPKRSPRGPGLPANPRRRPNRFSGFDPRDDLPLGDLGAGGGAPAYLGPYPLFNTTLNLVGGEDLAYQDRKGASFVLTPDYCGSRETGYALLPTGADKHNLTLGRAMTISGAAIDPNMKDYQSAQLTAFLTILNARLGWWIRNPNAPGAWTAAPPNQGAIRYLSELFGYTTESDAYVHLSDGGHFDASGAYELIRRRCRYVIAIDAAEDTDDASENLANLIRLVRADFGIAIDIDTAPLHKDDKGISRWHCAVGAIRYDAVDKGGVAGTFVFIRSSLTGDESAELKNYANTNPPFPHHSTVDQFFDDVQFESYRRLGEHIGLKVFADPTEETRRFLATGSDALTFNRWLFSEVRRRWGPAPPGGDRRYAESCRNYLAQSGGVTNLCVNRSLYPELKCLRPAAATDAIAATTPPNSGAREAAEARADQETLAEMDAISHLFQMMELAWLDNDLTEFHAHAINRGWMNALRRWTASDQFHRFWAVLRPMYSRGFVRFCERTLNMPDLPVRWCRIDDPYSPTWGPILSEFDREFGKEWAELFQERREFANWREAYISSAARAPQRLAFAPEMPRGAVTWVVTVGRLNEPRGSMTEDQWTDHIPLGVVVAHSGGTAYVWDILVWIRPWYRSAGLARLTMDVLLPKLESTVPRGVKWLRARYPVVGRSGGDDLLRTTWTLFFNDLGFVRGDRSDRELQLVKPLG
jgi:hypothetical protein